MARRTANYYIYFFGFVFALALHLGVAAILSFSNHASHLSVTGKQDYFIKAELYPLEDLNGRKENKSKEEVVLKARRLEEASLRAKQAKIEKEINIVREAAPKVIAKIESEKPTKEKTKTEEKNIDFLLDLDRALMQEERLWEAKTERDRVLAYVANIQDRIVRKWSRPPSARNGMRCVLRVVLLPTGEVLQASVEESSGNEAFDNSAKRAVFMASNLPVPEDNFLFEKSFREFTLLFRPDDLRL